MVELLEARAVPATFTVLNLTDSGAGSLRQAILDANAALGADVIAFAPAVHGTLTLTSGELSVTDDGCGFAPSVPVGSGRVGLMSMKERAVAVGGSLSVTSSPGGGTSVEVRLSSLN